MEFCPNCNNKLEETRSEDYASREQLTILVCHNCGYSQLPPKESEDEASTRQQEETEIKVIDPRMNKRLPTPFVDAACPNCGNDKAAWTMIQTDRADEPSTQFFRCTECGHTWREE